jgi:enoyl-CoA hydratase/carnithine racemase
MSGPLEIARTGRVLRIALNRPEKRNALNADLCLELVRLIQEAQDDASVGAIGLTGNGPSFCAGMDLGEIGVASSERLDQAHEQLFTLGSRMSKPLIAGVEGPALGGGTGLVANCHIVVASEQATFGLTEIRLGLWPFLVFRAVSAALGERKTLELALSGRIFDAKEAKSDGLVHEIAPNAAARAMAVAENIAAWSPTAIRSGMVFVQQVRERSWEDAGEIARIIRKEVFESGDFREGIQAFREKRKPKWPSLGNPVD